MHTLLIGGSRGIGLAAASHRAARGDLLWCVSRSPSPHGTWIAADLATPAGCDAVIARLAHERIDALLHLGGTWEEGAFTDAYRFDTSPPAELDRVLAVNLAAPIRLVQGLLPALRRSDNPRVVLMGSLSGRDNAASAEVANTASKFGLRGAAQALRLAAPDVPVGVINPGNIATAEVRDDIAAGRFPAQVPIPMGDLLAAIDFMLGLSPAASVLELDLGQANRHDPPQYDRGSPKTFSAM